MASSIFTINWKDAGEGLLVAFLTAFLGGISQAVNDGALPTLDQLKVSALAGLAAGVAFLLKQFLTNSTGQIAKAEKPVQVS